MAKRIAELFGLRCGIIGATTVTIKKGPLPLDQVHRSSLPLRANNLGKNLVRKASAPRRVPTVMDLWINILRKYLLSKLVMEHPETFTAVIEMRPDLYRKTGRKRSPGG